MSPTAADPKGKKVLIVEDDEPILTLLEILVKRDGFQVIKARDALEGIAKLALAPDLILLDIFLPGGKSGVEVLKHLKGMNLVPPVLVVTAYDAKDPTVAEACRDPNVVQCLAKPIRQDLLLEAMHRLLKTQRPPERALPPRPEAKP